jgi:hypothetical protein
VVWKLPITGETRTVTRFTFLPTVIGDEVWWLESIIIHQSYNTQHRGWNNDWAERKQR